MAQTASSWKLSTGKGEFSISTYVGVGGETGWATVTITDPDGERHEFKGSATIERTRRYDANMREVFPITKVTVRSLTGAIAVSAKSAKAAGEAYGTEAARVVVDAFKPSAKAAEQLTLTMSRAQWERVSYAMYQLTWRGDADALTRSAADMVEALTR